MEASTLSEQFNVAKPSTHDPYDITTQLMAYDWREATNHWDAPSKRAARGLPPIDDEGSQRDTAAPSGEAAASLKAEPVELPLTSVAPTDHVHRPAHGVSYQQPMPSMGGGRGARVSAYTPLGAPQATHRRASEAPVAAQKDAAAMMLETLQSKLSCIQSQVRSMPRTGYAPQSRSTRTPSSQQAPPSPKASLDDLDILDEEFVALVDCPMPTSASAPALSRKRKAEEILEGPPTTGFDFSSESAAYEMPPEIKKADLKTRNRWSAKASRIRKKAHLDKLHTQIDQLTNHNLELASVCEELVQDNALLRKELQELGGQLPKAPNKPTALPATSRPLSELL